MDPPSPAMEINEIRWWSVSPLHSRGFRWALNEFMYDLTQPIIIIDLLVIVRSLGCTSDHLLVLKIMPSCTRNTVVWCHCDFWTTSGVFVRLFHFQPILSLSLSLPSFLSWRFDSASINFDVLRNEFNEPMFMICRMLTPRMQIVLSVSLIVVLEPNSAAMI